MAFENHACQSNKSDSNIYSHSCTVPYDICLPFMDRSRCLHVIGSFPIAFISHFLYPSPHKCVAFSPEIVDTPLSKHPVTEVDVRLSTSKPRNIVFFFSNNVEPSHHVLHIAFKSFPLSAPSENSNQRCVHSNVILTKTAALKTKSQHFAISKATRRGDLLTDNTRLKVERTPP